MSAMLWCIVALLLTSTVPSYSQWQRIDLGVSTSFSDVCFLSDEKGFVVGADATAFRTDDGGRTWRKQPIAKTGAFSRIDFADSLHGWVASTSGVFSTRDGGQTWDSVSNLAATYISFVDSRRGWACGNGWISRTTDAGVTWTRQLTVADFNILRIDFVDENVGCAAGSWGKIYWTEDGGTNWRQCNSPTGRFIYGIQVLSPTMAIGSHEGGGAFRTTDGGLSWKSSPGVAGHGLAINMDTSGIGFVVGAHGRIHRSTDSGATWSYDVYPSGVTSMYDCIDKYCYFGGVFVGSTSAWAVGQGGGVFKRSSKFVGPCTGVPLSVKSQSLHCRGGTSLFHVSAFAGTSIAWELPKKGTLVSGSLRDSTIIVRWFDTGLDSIRVRVTRDEDPTCYRDTLIAVTISNSPDSSTTGARLVCQHSITTHRVEPIPGRAYIWTVSSGGFILGDADRDSVVIVWRHASNASDTVYVREAIIESGCSTATVYLVSVIPHVFIIEEHDGTLASSVSSAESYQWLNGRQQPIAGAISQRYKPLETGTYFVVAEHNGCIDTSDAYTYGVVSVPEDGDESRAPRLSLKSRIVKVAPIPSQHVIQIDVEIDGDATIDIVALDGRRVNRRIVNRDVRQLHIDLDGISTGIYVLILNTPDGFDHAPLVVTP